MLLVGNGLVVGLAGVVAVVIVVIVVVFTTGFVVDGIVDVFASDLGSVVLFIDNGDGCVFVVVEFVVLVDSGLVEVVVVACFLIAGVVDFAGVVIVFFVGNSVLPFGIFGTEELVVCGTVFVFVCTTTLIQSGVINVKYLEFPLLSFVS